jgi:hypothetical protein
MLSLTSSSGEAHKAQKSDRREGLLEELIHYQNRASWLATALRW